MNGSNGGLSVGPLKTWPAQQSKFCSVNRIAPRASLETMLPQFFRKHTNDGGRRAWGWNATQLPDLAGSYYIVTGSTSGIGLAAAKELYAKNAHVIIAGRNPDKGAKSVGEVQEFAPHSSGAVEFMLLNLASFKSVKAFAEEYAGRGYPLHGLALNAGVQRVEDDRTEEGFEITVGTNYFGHFYLAHLLLDQLRRTVPARCVWQASPEEAAASIDWDDLTGKDVERSADMQYWRSKVFDIMASREMNRRLEGSGVEAFACHPGVTKSEIFEKADWRHKLTSWFTLFGPLIGQSTHSGVTSLLYCLAQPSVDGQGGGFFGPMYLPLLPLGNLWQTHQRQPYNSHAKDPQDLKRLYDESIKVVQAFDPAIQPLAEPTKVT